MSVIVWIWIYQSMQLMPISTEVMGGCHGHDRMVVGFTTTCVISTHPH